MTFAITLVALARPSGDLVAGLVIGAALGFLVGPFVRHRLAIREWTTASREARLTDDLLERLPTLAAPSGEEETSPEPTEVDHPEAVRWPTSR